MNFVKSPLNLRLLNKSLNYKQVRYFTQLPSLYTNSQSSSNPIPNYTNSELLEFALERVPQVGFTTQAIQRSCLSLDYPDTPEQFEANGGFELVKHYMVSRRLKTIENVKQVIKESESEGKKLNKDELLKLCFKKRIELSEPVIGKWSEAVAFLTTSESGIKLLTLELYNLIDDFLHISGDKSADMSWYYKRLMYSKIFTSTEIYMTEDKSPKFIDTYNFLESQLNDVKAMGNGLNNAGDLINFIGKNIIGSINSTGRNI